jgi:hypothetical protein
LPVRKSLFDFDHAKLNYAGRFAIAKIKGRGVEFEVALVMFFQKLVNIDQRLRNRERMMASSPSSSAPTGD